MKLFSCKHVSTLVSKQLDQKLSWREYLRLKMHLAMCRHCSRFRKQMRILKKISRRYASRSKIRFRLSSQARKRIREAMKGNADQSN